jgi:hypothetical protein
MVKSSGLFFQVEVMEHWVTAYIGHLQKEVNFEKLLVWLKYLVFTAVFRMYMFMMVLGFEQFLI